ncbi:hypothetical protein DFP72DRAFT_817228, partial [Ephemerocybe angulata]
QPSSALPPSLFASVIPAPPALPKPKAPPATAPPEPTDTTSPPSKHYPVESKKNSFGLYKKFGMYQYGDSPHDPDSSVTPKKLREHQELPDVEGEPSKAPSRNPTLYPFPNLSSFRLGEWFWSDSSEKSHDSFAKLVDIVSDSNFRPQDLQGTNWKRIDTILAASEYDDGVDSAEWVDDGDSWAIKSITISVPFAKTSVNPGCHAFTVPGFHHRPLIPIIRAKLECLEAQEHFHTMGFDLRWCPGEGKEDMRTFGEMYTSKAFVDAYEALQRSPPEPGCTLPRYVVCLMFASDATMLACFGSAKVWPLYLFFANESKYNRSKPSERLFETVAYFEKLPDHFKDFMIEHTGQKHLTKAHEAVITHCQRELFHEQWKLILDEEFVEAYSHGIVVKGYDGEKRRFYPRILTYSADYPEKILIASIKNLGKYPCPRCRVLKVDIPAMGQKQDLKNRSKWARVDDNIRKEHVKKAREFLYDQQLSILSSKVETRLSHGSLVATENAFSTRLSSHGFDLYPMLVVDILHEVEIGVWKALFIHLLRLLEATEKGLTNTLDARYREMPTYGRDTIRRFVNNVSEMKQLAARDFEDLLQCAIPAFEGLLPAPHNNRVMKLLFVLGQWHGLAKLRLHTDHTLTMLEEQTVQLGESMRKFVKETCAAIPTKELQREYQARKRRETSAKRKEGPAAPGADDEDGGPKPKTLNLETYKYHSLGDVAPTIRLFGTTDSYSTQIPERFHRYPKMHYKRTSKKDVNRQLSRIQMRQNRIRRLRRQLLPDPSEEYTDENASTNPYFIGKSQNNPVSLPSWIQKKRDDPAVKDFMPKLRAHLLPRIYSMLIKEELDSEDGPDSQRLQRLQSLQTSLATDHHDTESNADRIFFHSDRIYQHQLLHINYTTYDVRRETDIINPSMSRRYVMCLRQLDDDDEDYPNPHRFVHAQVLGVYHANLIYRGEGATDLRKRRVDFLFIRWFEFCHESSKTNDFDRLQLQPANSEGAMGFLDPSDIIRASYINPRFSLGRRYPAADTSRIASKTAKDKEDWKEYYINRFVDRDMLMRYIWGHGVGHKYSHTDAPRAPPSTSGAAPEAVDLALGSAVNSDGQHGETDITTDGVPDLQVGENGDADGGVCLAKDHEHGLDNLEAEELDVGDGEDEFLDDVQQPEDEDATGSDGD